MQSFEVDLYCRVIPSYAQSGNMPSIRDLLAELLLKTAVLIILTMDWLYRHRLISYGATRHFFAVSRCLRARAERCLNRRRIA
jgi:hypothetical protein